MDKENVVYAVNLPYLHAQIGLIMVKNNELKNQKKFLKQRFLISTPSHNSVDAQKLSVSPALLSVVFKSLGNLRGFPCS
jgi:hypothetical protein